MANKENSIINVVVIIIVVIIILYFMMVLLKEDDPEKYTPEKDFGKENYIPLNDQPRHTMDYTGSSYKMLPNVIEEEVPVNFADMIESGGSLIENYVHEKRDVKSENPMKRLERLQGSELLPRSSSVTPYNIDVTDPKTFQYMTRLPRVITRSKYYQTDLATSIRGDIPIKQTNIPLVTRTHLDLKDVNYNGLFTDYFEEKYHKYNGVNKNIPQHIAGAGQALGYGGASGGVIMDNY